MQRFAGLNSIEGWNLTLQLSSRSWPARFSCGKLVRLGDIMVYSIRYRLCSYSLSRSVNKWHKESKANEGRL